MSLTKFAVKNLMLAVLLVIGTTTSTGNVGGVSWFKDLNKASEVAKKTNQPMMIEFWADWCEACTAMEDQVYNDPRVVAAVNDKVVPVRIHFDLQKDLVEKYNVPALPYLVFTTSNGTELMHHRGTLEAADLTALIKAFPSDVSKLNRLDRALEVNKNDFESLMAMGRELRIASFLGSSNRYYTKAIKQDAAKNDPAKRESILMEMGLNFLDLKQSKQAMEIFEKCLKEFPQSPNRPDLMLNLAQSYILAQQNAKARKSLLMLIEAFPQSAASNKAQALMKSL